MTQQVMSQAEAGGLRVQLESVVRSLEAFENAAREAGDVMMLALVAQLRQAHRTAAQIEAREPMRTQGVTLVRN